MLRVHARAADPLPPVDMPRIAGCQRRFVHSVSGRYSQDNPNRDWTL
jgi:hypothetical protein